MQVVLPSHWESKSNSDPFSAHKKLIVQVERQKNKQLIAVQLSAMSGVSTEYDDSERRGPPGGGYI